MRKRFLIGTAVAVVLGVIPAANAHQEHAGKEATARCDSWYRQGHFADANNDGKPDEPYNGSHHHKSSSDINDLNAVAHTEIHGQSGHYVVRNDYGYVEVVGGQSYKGPSPQSKFFPGQGGYVQGEIDVANGAPDAEFFAAAFGPKTETPPTDPNGVVPWVNGSYAKACVDASGQRAEQQTRTP